MSATFNLQKKNVILLDPCQLNRRTACRENSRHRDIYIPWWAHTDPMLARDERALDLLTLQVLVATSRRF
jgi:hypothetical protein